MCVKNNTIMYVARTSNNRVISSGDLYCCLLPRCEALRTCRSGFPIATRRIKSLSPPCPQKLSRSTPSWLLSTIYRCTAKTSIHLSVKSELNVICYFQYRKLQAKAYKWNDEIYCIMLLKYSGTGLPPVSPGKSRKLDFYAFDMDSLRRLDRSSQTL